MVETRSIANRFESRQGLPPVLIKKDGSVEFFERGSELVWIVTFEDRTVLVLRPDGSEAVVAVADGLHGEDIVAGFSLGALWACMFDHAVTGPVAKAYLLVYQFLVGKK